MTEFSDREGRPLDLISWAQTLGDDDYRVIARDEVGPYTITTVWNGFDYFPPDEGPHRVFSSGIYLTDEATNPDGFELAEEELYVTEQEAIEGHAALVEAYKEKSSDH